ncbi:hypothetical protein C2845_PM09G24750 [Panicum miliaceum]|uniref:Uncharacterized protein n=1 Tax=Panicum miliaceum TaxID=4540 RepID=A0A3L6S2C9_PANMI|nr:hypothetical protein C2845_PM09G24750 [Panicum miliaceum]
MLQRSARKIQSKQQTGGNPDKRSSCHMAAARIVAARCFAFADEPALPEMLDVVRRQRQLLRRAAALCLDPIAEETGDDTDATCVSSSPFPFAAGRSWASSSAAQRV